MEISPLIGGTVGAVRSAALRIAAAAEQFDAGGALVDDSCVTKRQALAGVTRLQWPRLNLQASPQRSVRTIASGTKSIEGNVMSNTERRLRGDSDTLLRKLDELKDLEQEKRQVLISSDRFHQLADDIEGKSREVFEVAADERYTGNRIPETQDVSTEDVTPTPTREPSTRRSINP
jgi:hypothetical protein